MPTTVCSEGRRLAGALAAWLDARLGGDRAKEASCQREAARLAQALGSDPVLGPAMARHLPGGEPASEEGAVACILAVMEADGAAREAAPNN